MRPGKWMTTAAICSLTRSSIGWAMGKAKEDDQRWGEKPGPAGAAGNGWRCGPPVVWHWNMLKHVETCWNQWATLEVFAFALCCFLPSHRGSAQRFLVSLVLKMKARLTILVLIPFFHSCWFAACRVPTRKRRSLTRPAFLERHCLEVGCDPWIENHVKNSRLSVKPGKATPCYTRANLELIRIQKNANWFNMLAKGLAQDSRPGSFLLSYCSTFVYFLYMLFLFWNCFLKPRQDQSQRQCSSALTWNPGRENDFRRFQGSCAGKGFAPLV